MKTIYEADTQKSIEKIKELLKQLIKAPEWTKFVKTSHGNQRPPSQSDWFYTRAAAILITIYKRGPIGTNKLRVKYGTKKNRGHKPEKFAMASGKIIRNILQQLEKANLIKFKKEGVHKGRIITPKGTSLINKNAVMEK